MDPTLPYPTLPCASTAEIHKSLERPGPNPQAWGPLARSGLPNAINGPGRPHHAVLDLQHAHRVAGGLGGGGCLGGRQGCPLRLGEGKRGGAKLCPTSARSPRWQPVCN